MIINPWIDAVTKVKDTKIQKATSLDRKANETCAVHNDT